MRKRFLRYTENAAIILLFLPFVNNFPKNYGQWACIKSMSFDRKDFVSIDLSNRDVLFAGEQNENKIYTFNNLTLFY